MRSSLRLIAFVTVVLMLGGGTVFGCLWDSDTLFSEKWNRPALAEIILSERRPPVDSAKYLSKIDSLTARPQPNDPDWLNNLAGAYMRVGQYQRAVELLAPRSAQCTNDYGVQANLGTAYHLLGRYAEAERHIARDLELKPHAHFGLEKFHLALLQYLVRDEAWKQRRVYVDEFSAALHRSGHLLAWRSPLSAEDQSALLGTDSAEPAYRSKWNLAEDPQLTEGVSYMALLNPKEPAAFEILGIVCWKNRDLNLAAGAFERAISLSSPKAALLGKKVKSIRAHISMSQPGITQFLVPLAGICIVAVAFVLWKRRRE